MARIRTIKPDFWTSEQIMECSTNARLMFIGMWNFADDTGRLPYSAKSIKAKIFPSDDISLDAIHGMLRELSANDLIIVYAVDGEEYLQITGWQHQRIDKPQPSKYPAPFFDDSGNVIGMVPPDRKGEDRKEKNSRSVADATRPSAPDAFEEFWRSFPRREGPNPRKSAEQKFNALVKTGVDPWVMISGAKQLAADEARRGNIGTRFIPQAATWLNQQRWVDHAAVAFTSAEQPKEDWDAACKQWLALKRWPKGYGNDPESPACRAPPEVLRKHGIQPMGASHG